MNYLEHRKRTQNDVGDTFFPVENKQRNGMSKFVYAAKSAICLQMNGTFLSQTTHDTVITAVSNSNSFSLSFFNGKNT